MAPVTSDTPAAAPKLAAQPSPSGRSSRSAGVVLIVEDDAVTRLAYQRILEKRGYTVHIAPTGALARSEFERTRNLDAAILDYSLPDANGIELLSWMRIRDPHLAAILVTAIGEKEVVARSLSAGACGYLDKPVRGEDLSREIAQIVAQTRRRRRLARMVEEVQEVGDILQSYHRSVIEPQNLDLPLDIGLYYYPHFEVGGDYLAHHRLSPDEWLVMAVDVSGHDLSAACTSAFFQGLFSGVLSRGGTPEQVVRLFHSSLLAQQAVRGPDSPLISAAVCCLRFTPGSVEVSCHGCPQPVLIEPDGATRRIGAQREPLGWFDDFEWKPELHALPPGSLVHIWTDGLEDLAVHLGVDPLALAHTIGSTPRGDTAEGIAEAADDVMLATIRPRAGASPQDAPAVILSQCYQPSDISAIDSFQSLWHRSLEWTIPNLAPCLLHDILLCTREAVLNSIRHGCAAGQSMNLDFLYHPQAQLLNVRVCDPGPGHDYDWSRALSDDGVGMRDHSRGLLLIHSLARAVYSQRNGAHLTMEFDLKFQ